MLRLNGWRWISRISVFATLPSTLSSMTVLPAENWLQELLDFARVDRERLRLAAVAVDDGRELAGLAKLARDARAALGAGRRVE